MNSFQIFFEVLTVLVVLNSLDSGPQNGLGLVGGTGGLLVSRLEGF